MKGSVGIILGAWCAIVIACAAGSHRASAPPTMQQGPQQNAPRPNSPEADQIDALFAEIDQQRGALKLPEQHGERVMATDAHATAMSGGTAPVAPANAACQPKGQSDTCKQSCTLSNSICGNAKKICDIAEQMAGDAWAAQKCADGNATCDAAKKQCCNCTP